MKKSINITYFAMGTAIATAIIQAIVGNWGGFLGWAVAAMWAWQTTNWMSLYKDYSEGIEKILKDK